MKWYYKSAGHPKDYQFRSSAAGTSKEFPKDIIANLWNWDKNWKVEWLENGKVMGTMTQYTGVDPYAHQVCTDKKKKPCRAGYQQQVQDIYSVPLPVIRKS
ncbi:calcineurin-like phosphoesterase C-terminal domain-containing protein [Bacteroides thetaiotaomicron]|nr:calcineurin-like phosphoesterase C-terminal domain-containing protein [Bacteroides thetaiotaomicron]